MKKNTFRQSTPKRNWKNKKKYKPLIINKIVRSFLILFFFLNFLSSTAQVYPVKVIPNVIPPFSLKLSDYQTSTSEKLVLNLLMNDVNVVNRQVKLKMYLESNRIKIQNTPVVIGASPLFLEGGIPLRLTNLDIKPYFSLNNLQGISPQQYSSPLPDGYYRFCFEVYDFITGRRLSNKSCFPVYLILNDPPLLNFPWRGELISQKDPQNILFNWTPRHLNATGVQYEFTLKEIWDIQIDPQAAFLASPVLFQTTTYATTLLYGSAQTPLLPDKTYAWQVRALITDGISETSVFKNNGKSEIYYFIHTSNCEHPTFVLTESGGMHHEKIMWQPGINHLKYQVQYRKVSFSTESESQRKKRASKNNKRIKKGQKPLDFVSKKINYDWFEATANNPFLTLYNLEAGTTYEFRVGGQCNFNGGFSYSQIQEFTTPTKEQDRYYSCGFTSEISIGNKNPLDNLGINEVFTASDFPITVKEVYGSNGIFSGWGYTVVPYLADTKIKVGFNKIHINSDYQLIEGQVVTSYDATWKHLVDTGPTVQAVGDVLEFLGESIETLIEGIRNNSEINTLANSYIKTLQDIVNDSENGLNDIQQQELEDLLANPDLRNTIVEGIKIIKEQIEKEGISDEIASQYMTSSFTDSYNDTQLSELEIKIITGELEKTINYDAVVLLNNQVVKASSFYSIDKWDGKGKVLNFTYNNIQYIATERKNLFVRYVEKQKYNALERKIKIEVDKASISFDISQLIKAAKNDIIYGEFKVGACAKGYTWPFDGNSPEKPTNATLVEENCYEFSSITAQNFYDQRKNKGIDNNLVADIAKLIDQIDELVYKQFTEDAVNSLRTIDKSFYLDGWIYNTEPDYVNYRDSLAQFIEQFQENKEAIYSLSTPEKMLILASKFSLSQLKSLTFEDQLKMLTVISKGSLTGYWNIFSGNDWNGELMANNILASVSLENSSILLEELLKKNPSDNPILQKLINGIDGNNFENFRNILKRLIQQTNYELKYRLIKILLDYGYITNEKEEDIILDTFESAEKDAKQLYEKINSDYELLEALISSIDDTSGKDNFVRFGKEFYLLFDRAYSKQEKETKYGELLEKNKLYFYGFNNELCTWKISSNRSKPVFSFEENHVYNVEWAYNPVNHPAYYNCDHELATYEFDYNALLAVDFIESENETGYDDGIHLMPAICYYIMIRAHNNEQIRNQLDTLWIVLGVVTPIDEFYLLGKALQYGKKALRITRLSKVKDFSRLQKIEVVLNPKTQKLKKLTEQVDLNNHLKFVEEVSFDVLSVVKANIHRLGLKNFDNLSDDVLTRLEGFSDDLLNKLDADLLTIKSAINSKPELVGSWKVLEGLGETALKNDVDWLKRVGDWDGAGVQLSKNGDNLKLSDASGIALGEFKNGNLLPKKYDFPINTNATPVGDVSNGYQIFKDGSENLSIRRVPDKSSYNASELKELTQHPNAHVLERHGHDVTDDALIKRAQTPSVAPDGKVANNPPPHSSKFNSAEDLREGLNNTKPGTTAFNNGVQQGSTRVVTYTSTKVLGKGVPRNGSSFVDMQKVKAIYRNVGDGNYQLITIYPEL